MPTPAYQTLATPSAMGWTPTTSPQWVKDQPDILAGLGMLKLRPTVSLPIPQRHRPGKRKRLARQN